MKKLTVISITLLLLSVALAQQNLTPSELEQAKLAKLKAQRESLTYQRQLLESNYRILDQLEKQKESEYEAYAQQVIKEHKWEADFNPSGPGEYGQFVERKKDAKK